MNTPLKSLGVMETKRSHKIMILVDISSSHREMLVASRETNGMTASQIVSKGLKDFDGRVLAVEGEGKMIRLYLDKLEKRKLEKLSSCPKVSISAIVRTLIAKALSLPS